ncbi:7TM diverse intracellular signaling domain-containing protein [Pinibacter soli]|uniref:7TM diverse intracellular signaling domain-containing protein n=1 Tax=Pinibacter soli TaxID=3044211 RepID=A0ABT6REE8_9BACT|nr:7TM diverse intracellular signaling domain-containing protein [Pinibacter soli]MDI3320945.1 7TM diverse intracellular signaling domain-containing protein [Pinibacter soli]
MIVRISAHKKSCIWLAFFIVFATRMSAQIPVPLDHNIEKHIFSYDEIQIFEDAKGQYTITDVGDSSFNNKFATSRSFIPKTFHYKSTYWFRVRVRNVSKSNKNWVFEFYDQTIDNIRFYSPNDSGRFDEYECGAMYPFNQRQISHKNFTIQLSDDFSGDKVFYFAIRSQQPPTVMVVIKPVEEFIKYGLREYILLGFFYGMMLIFCLYNFMMFAATRQRQYIYYIVYNFSIGIFEMSSNGIAYQYLWPSFPRWNDIAFGVALYTATIGALLFTASFLRLKTKAPRLYKLVAYAIVLRTVFFAICLFINNHWFVYKFVDGIAILFGLYCGIVVLRKKYYPARFFVAGYSFLLLGFSIRVLKVLALVNLPFGPFNYYSLSFCFILEMMFVSFAIGESVSYMKKEKDRAQQRVIEEMKRLDALKEELNKELEVKVVQRTKEVTEQASIIKQQNDELQNVNELLSHQAIEIKRMNALLKEDNETLHTDIEKIAQARVLSSEVNFEEFSKVYPDNESCYKFLANLKWNDSYQCKKCGNEHYGEGKTSFSRRCSKCGYEESATAYTIFHNTRIPVNKGFYMLFLIYTSKGKISSHQLSEILEIRQSTCWSYSSKIKKLMEERKKELKNAGERGWSKLVFEDTVGG